MLLRVSRRTYFGDTEQAMAAFEARWAGDHELRRAGLCSNRVLKKEPQTGGAAVLLLPYPRCLRQEAASCPNQRCIALFAAKASTKYASSLPVRRYHLR
jgi:hypothetical protein